MDFEDYPMLIAPLPKDERGIKPQPVPIVIVLVIDCKSKKV